MDPNRMGLCSESLPSAVVMTPRPAPPLGHETERAETPEVDSIGMGVEYIQNKSVSTELVVGVS